MKQMTIALAVFAILLAPAAGWGETLTVQSSQARLLTKPSASARAVSALKEGMRLTVLKREGDYYHVKTMQGLKGYVHRSYVSDGSEEPSGGDKTLDTLLSALEPDTRTAKTEEDSSTHSVRAKRGELGEERSTHAIRGLTKSGQKGQSGLTFEQAEDQVADMEKVSVDDGELEKFQKEGGVGRHAR